MGKLEGFKTFALVFALFGIYLFIFSESGILKRKKLERNSLVLQQRIAALNKYKAELESVHQRLVNGEYREYDILKSGFLPAGERAVFFQGMESRHGTVQKTGKGDESYTLELAQLRILWIVLSILILLFYFTRRTGNYGVEK
ncbi:MAG: hypothetical protein GY754_43885 [bacterium]|nr:hypothetical protein [bacterium]